MQSNIKRKAKEDISYKKLFLFKKIAKILLVLIAGILFDLLMAKEVLFQTILVWAVYISVGILFIVDGLPTIISFFKIKYEKIILENLKMYFVIEKEEKELMIERFNIKSITFDAFLSSEISIPADKKIEDIDDSLYNLPGRKLIVETKNNEEYFIYLEFLDDEFLDDFIDWYQGNQVL